MNNSNQIVVRICQWHDKKAILSAIRESVFIKEQSVPGELEWDGEDDSAYHLLAYVNEIPVGTARLLPTGQIGRMSVLKTHRLMGVGAALLLAAEELAISLGMESVFLHAQSYISQFYASRGYHMKGSEFMDAGIPHIEMTKKL